jgi:hypothetical protein
MVNTKTATLTAQEIPSSPNGTTFPLLTNVSIVPQDVKGSFFGGEILILDPLEKFPESLIYMSNWNLGPEFDPHGDTIAIFKFMTLPVTPTMTTTVGR